MTHYFDCCKETCSWEGNARGYATSQCDATGETTLAPDGGGNQTVSVCDNGGQAATCKNRYPELKGDTLYGFVASGAELKKNFEDVCGQCFEVVFHEEGLPWKRALLQVTNTGDGSGIFDFEVPGGGFGAKNGCEQFGGWNVYSSSGGPCDPERDTENCKRYGGFQRKDLCDSSFGEDRAAKVACNDILFGGMEGNLKVKKYRRVKCPAWHSGKTGTKGPDLEGTCG